MSASHMAVIFAHSRAEGTTRLVALALANGYDLEADVVVESVSELERETAATSKQIERAVRKLVSLGEWAVVARTDGTRMLRMTLGCPVDCDGTAEHRSTWEVMSA